MITMQPDTELEYEIQELYILARHWLQDISFAEDELHFFTSLLKKCQAGADDIDLVFEWQEFADKIEEQEKNISELKVAVPLFLGYLAPCVGDLKKGMDLDLLEKYNGLDDRIKLLFNSVKITKQALFQYAEKVIDPVLIKSQQHESDSK